MAQRGQLFCAIALAALLVLQGSTAFKLVDEDDVGALAPLARTVATIDAFSAPTPGSYGGSACSGLEGECGNITFIPEMNVTLMTAGGLANCKGSFKSLLVNHTIDDLLTDSLGKFAIENSTLGTYMFPGGDSKCLDSITKKKVIHAHIVTLPACENAVITEASLLSVPAALLEEDPRAALGSRELLASVFLRLGFNESALGIDLLSFDGMTADQPVFTAFYGVNIQLACVFSCLTQALAPLFQAPATDSARHLLAAAAPTADVLQQQLAAAIWAQMMATNNSSALTGTTALTAILNQTFTSLEASYAAPSAPSASDVLVQLYAVIANVVSNVNKLLETSIVAAQAAQAAGQTYTAEQLVAMAGIAAVQQDQVMADIAAVVALATNGSFTNATQLAALLEEMQKELNQTYSEAALVELAKEKKITAADLTTAFAAINDKIMEAPAPAAEEKPYYGWIAGPVIAGVAVLAALGAVFFVIRRRRAARGGKYSINAGDGDARDGETPRSAV